MEKRHHAGLYLIFNYVFSVVAVYGYWRQGGVWCQAYGSALPNPVQLAAARACQGPQGAALWC